MRATVRADNAAARLTPLGRQWGMVDDARWAVYQQRNEAEQALREHLQRTKIDGMRMIDWARRPQVTAEVLLGQLNGQPLPAMARDRAVAGKLLADVQYAGYIDRQQRQIDKLCNQETSPLPADLDYQRVEGLRREAQHTLAKFRPTTLGQASRLAGVTPADLMLLSVSIGR